MTIQKSHREQSIFLLIQLIKLEYWNFYFYQRSGFGNCLRIIYKISMLSFGIIAVQVAIVSVRVSQWRRTCQGGCTPANYIVSPSPVLCVCVCVLGLPGYGGGFTVEHAKPIASARPNGIPSISWFWSKEAKWLRRIPLEHSSGLAHLRGMKCIIFCHTQELISSLPFFEVLLNFGRN